MQTMMKLKNKEEIELMRQSALLVSKTLAEIAKILKPGITTLSLDITIGEMIKSYGATPSFLNFHGYPFNSCISVNDVVVHGFPNNVALKEGDIVSIDMGVILNGWHGDHAYTFLIGEANEDVLQLLRVTKESLYKGIEKAVAGNRVGDIAFAKPMPYQFPHYTIAMHLFRMLLDSKRYIAHAITRYRFFNAFV